jgi:hypothetical protein
VAWADISEVGFFLNLPKLMKIKQNASEKNRQQNKDINVCFKQKNEIHLDFLNCLQIEREESVCQSNSIRVLQRLHCIRAPLCSS